MKAFLCVVLGLWGGVVLGFWVGSDLRNLQTWIVVTFAFLGGLFAVWIPKPDSGEWQEYSRQLEMEIEHLEQLLEDKDFTYNRWHNDFVNEISGDLGLAKARRYGVERWFRIADNKQIVFSPMGWIEILEKRYERLLYRAVKELGTDKDWEALEIWEMRTGQTKIEKG